MLLQKNVLPAIRNQNEISLPNESEFNLPEKVLQFGTGVLLRGLPDYYISKANRQGLFNGRVVVVKSTSSGSIDEYANQDNLYTHCIKGMVDGNEYESTIVNATISRVLNAVDNWHDVLDCANNPELKIIISNTTEVGIVLDETDQITAFPPKSFPGKLLSFLWARYNAFEKRPESGMTIIPTELLVDNGKKLLEIVLSLARINKMEDAFVDWLQTANNWCSSLVDRIVPGALSTEDKQVLAQKFGYDDNLAIMSEPYSLWAIEAKKEGTKKLLSFCEADKNIIITEDITKYRELKLRLLNASHTFSCGLAYASGFSFVNEAIKNKDFSSFLKTLMYKEIIPCLVDDIISINEAKAFADAVFDRFANPFIQHKWLSITLQYTGKIKQRCVPLLLKHYTLTPEVPKAMSLGFAAYLLFSKPVTIEDGKYYGERENERYLIQDDEAAKLASWWEEKNMESVVKKALGDRAFWKTDLTELPQFGDAVLSYLNKLMEQHRLPKL